MMKTLGGGIVSAGLVLAFAGSAMAQYTVTNLVSNTRERGVNTDPRLVNGWGIAASPVTPFWVSDNGTGVSTLYDGGGRQIPLVVTIPPAPSMPFGPLGTPTGQVVNTTSDFVITENGKSGPALFIFATLDGTISGWNPAVDLTHAVIMVDNSGSGTVYTGLAIGKNTSGANVLYAGDSSSNNRVDMIGGTWNSLGSFTDASIPEGLGLTVYGVQNITGNIYVTYASETPLQGGVVDVFDTQGNLLTPSHFYQNAPGGALEAPWGVVQAPINFGQFSGAILIGNVDDGKINAFDPGTHNLLGTLSDSTGAPIQIYGLWGLEFGLGSVLNGPVNSLFFTAGPDNYADGLFGVITAGTGRGR